MAVSPEFVNVTTTSSVVCVQFGSAHMMFGHVPGVPSVQASTIVIPVIVTYVIVKFAVTEDVWLSPTVIGGDIHVL